jgi:spore photoproduct lyase
MDIFGQKYLCWDLLINYAPMNVPFFKPERIFLAKGSMVTENLRRFVESILLLYLNAQIIDCPNIPHNQISLGEMNQAERHKTGKKTLVFGEHGSAVRFSDEEGNTCPN